MYGFVGNNPLGGIDPWGLDEKSIGRRIGECVGKWLYDKATETSATAEDYNPDTALAMWAGDLGVGDEGALLRDVVVDGAGTVGEAGEEAAKNYGIGKAAGACFPVFGKLLRALRGKGDEVVEAVEVVAKSSDDATKGLPKTRDALIDLRNKGFEYKSTSPNGYVTYKGPDGRTVTIKPSGEVIPTQRGRRQMVQASSRNAKITTATRYSTSHILLAISLNLWLTSFHE